MRLSCGVLSLALRIFLPVLCAPLPAQSDPGQWVGDLYMVMVPSEEGHTSAAFVDEDDNVRRVIPNVWDAADFKELCRSCGGGPWHSHWHGDALHSLAYGGMETAHDGIGRAGSAPGGTAYRRYVFAKWQDGGWGLMGTFRANRRELLHAVPCDGGRYIVVSHKMGTFDDARSDRSPFRRVSAAEGGGDMRLDASIDHGQDELRGHMYEPMCLDHDEVPGMITEASLRGYMSEPSCFNLAAGSDIVMTEGRATLVNRFTGLYWVFSTETARLVKAGSIFKRVTPEMAARGGFYNAVLCVNPEKSGTVLLSAQDEVLFTAEKEDPWKEMRERWAKVPIARMLEPSSEDDWINELFERRLAEIKARSPLVVWYRIHPENGRVERLPLPPEGGASVRGPGDRDECWRPMPDGSVRMGWDPQYMDKMKASVSGWTGASDGPDGPKGLKGLKGPKDIRGEGASEGAEGQGGPGGAGLVRGGEAWAEAKGDAPRGGGGTGNEAGNEAANEAGMDKDMGKNMGKDGAQVRHGGGVGADGGADGGAAEGGAAGANGTEGAAAG
jgi:hypothetical protein